MTRLTMKIAALALSLMPVSLPTFANAAAWVVEPQGSSVAFDYMRNGNPATGTFGSFKGAGKFDPVRPEEASITIRIDTRSIDLKDALATAFATSTEWFDSKNHPFVVYELTTLTPRPDGNYDAKGLLTLRGKTLPVSAVLALDLDEKAAKATGTLRLNRADYLLGVGPSAAFVTIGAEVAVRFDLKGRVAR
jgi:polyisoprenoid-binding protein YceI